MRTKVNNGDSIYKCSLEFEGAPGREGSGLVYTCVRVGAVKQMTNAHIFYLPEGEGETVKIPRNQLRMSEGRSLLGIVRGMTFGCYTPSEELCKNLCTRAAHEIREKHRATLEEQQSMMKSLMRPIAGLEDMIA